MSIAPSHLPTARAVSIVLAVVVGGPVGFAAGEGGPAAVSSSPPAAADREVATAIADLEAAIEQEPRNAELRFRLGNVRYATADMPGAAAEYERAIGLSPNFAKAHEHLACAQARQGAYAEAITGFTRALALAPNDYETWEYRAFAKRDAGLLLGAIEDLTVSARLAPTRAASRLARGQIHFDLTAYDAAVDDLRAACALEPSDPDEARLYLWLAMAARGDRTAASADLAAYVDRRSGPLAHDWLPALAGFVLGDVEETELLGIAGRGDDGPEKQQRLCEAHFCVGFRRLLDDNPSEAVEALRQCVATGASARPEYRSAVAALDRLAGKSLAGAGSGPDLR